MIKLNDKLKKLIPLAIGGLLLAGFQLYNTSGKFGVSEISVLAITVVITMIIILFVNKIVSKND